MTTKTKRRLKTPREYLENILKKEQYSSYPDITKLPGFIKKAEGVYLVNTVYRGAVDMQYPTELVKIQLMQQGRWTPYGVYSYEIYHFNKITLAEEKMLQVKELIAEAEKLAIESEVHLRSPISAYGMGGEFSWEEGRWISSSEGC